MKKILFFILAFLLIPSVFAINIEVTKQSSKEIIVRNAENPAIFGVDVKNNGPDDDFMFYSFFGASFYPKGTVHINAGETKSIELQIYGLDQITKNEYLSFDYFIRSQDGTEQKQNLLLRIVELENAFEIKSEDLDPESNSLTISVMNKINFSFENIHAEFSSPFFELREEFSLAPLEEKEFSVKLNKEDFKKLSAGFYTLDSKIIFKNQEAEIESSIKFVEKEIIQTNEEDYGLIIRTKIIKKENNGNVATDSNIAVQKNIISRLVTTFNIQPDVVDRKGTLVYYSWNKKINPGEELEVSVRTNWVFPLIVLVLLIAIAVLIKIFSGRNLVVKKKIQFVRAKGGEFGLKVSLFLHAKKFVEKVNLIDRLPPLVKIYERFGGEIPKVEENKKKLEWNFEKFEAEEKRMVSYIIYSKVGVLGKFAIPCATAIYEKDGKLKETQSNKVFFVSEQIKGSGKGKF